MKIEELKQLLNDSKDAPKDFIALIKEAKDGSCSTARYGAYRKEPRPC